MGKYRGRCTVGNEKKPTAKGRVWEEKEGRGGEGSCIWVGYEEVHEERE